MEKDQSIMDYQETVEILQVKVRKLEQLVKLKDRRIDGEQAWNVEACLPPVVGLTRAMTELSGKLERYETK